MRRAGAYVRTGARTRVVVGASGAEKREVMMCRLHERRSCQRIACGFAAHCVPAAVWFPGHVAQFLDQPRWGRSVDRSAVPPEASLAWVVQKVLP